MHDDTIVFERSGQTDLPQLKTRPGLLTEPERDELDAELRKRYDSLVYESQGKIVQLNTRLAAFPEARFRVAMDRNCRVPTIYLHPVSERSPAPCNQVAASAASHGTLRVSPQRPAPTRNWQAEFQDALDELLVGGSQSLDPAYRTLAFAIDELKDIIRSNPNLLLPILLAGYLRFAESTAVAEDDAALAGFYGIAARGLKAVHGSISLPWSSRVPSSTPMSRETISSHLTLRTFVSYVMNNLLPDGL